METFYLKNFVKFRGRHGPTANSLRTWAVIQRILIVLGDDSRAASGRRRFVTDCGGEVALP